MHVCISTAACLLPNVLVVKRYASVYSAGRLATQCFPQTTKSRQKCSISSTEGFGLCVLHRQQWFCSLGLSLWDPPSTHHTVYCPALKHLPEICRGSIIRLAFVFQATFFNERILDRSGLKCQNYLCSPAPCNKLFIVQGFGRGAVMGERCCIASVVAGTAAPQIKDTNVAIRCRLALHL